MKAVPSAGYFARVDRSPASPCFCAASNVASGANLYRAGFEPYQTRAASDASEHVWFWFRIPASPLLHSLRSFSRSLAWSHAHSVRSRDPRESTSSVGSD